MNKATRLTSVKGIKGLEPLSLFTARDQDDDAPENLNDLIHLPDMTQSQHIVEDYATTGLSLKGHPMEILHPITGGLEHKHLLKHKLTTISVTGVVMAPQRPGTAKGVCFLTLKDDTGIANIITYEIEDLSHLLDYMRLPDFPNPATLNPFPNQAPITHGNIANVYFRRVIFINCFCNTFFSN